MEWFQTWNRPILWARWKLWSEFCGFHPTYSQWRFQFQIRFGKRTNPDFRTQVSAFFPLNQFCGNCGLLKWWWIELWQTTGAHWFLKFIRFYKYQLNEQWMKMNWLHKNLKVIAPSESGLPPSCQVLRQLSSPSLPVSGQGAKRAACRPERPRRLGQWEGKPINLVDQASKMQGERS